jgi:hypothetical protein
MPILTVSIEYGENSGEFSPEYFAKLSAMSKFAHVAKAMAAFGGNMLTKLNSSIVFNGVRASGTITNSTAVPGTSDTVTIGGQAYAFKSTLASAYQVKIGATIADTMDNLLKAINGTGIDGTNYFAGTLANPNVYATAGATGVVNVIARYTGTAGNLITLAKSGTNLAVSAATLTSGTNGTAIV